MKVPIDPGRFISMLRSSLSHWKNTVERVFESICLLSQPIFKVGVSRLTCAEFWNLIILFKLFWFFSNWVLMCYIIGRILVPPYWAKLFNACKLDSWRGSYFSYTSHFVEVGVFVLNEEKREVFSLPRKNPKEKLQPTTIKVILCTISGNNTLLVQ